MKPIKLRRNLAPKKYACNGELRVEHGGELLLKATVPKGEIWYFNGVTVEEGEWHGRPSLDVKLTGFEREKLKNEEEAAAKVLDKMKSS